MVSPILLFSKNPQIPKNITDAANQPQWTYSMNSCKVSLVIGILDLFSEIMNPTAKATVATNAPTEHPQKKFETLNGLSFLFIISIQREAVARPSRCHLQLVRYSYF